ncbi:hypothetical protein [Nostoc sp. FACHB-888]|uniref:hypothetical protein n=1 Tax=Nostoc sp. FACHB-888 TaxID=2692842 RepID=UPI001688890B|nr:hypothetical protein [Nostoc sp. FACHB-888]MBD2243368.1 hypothetical protein [Nostoc sp. FACHB-888]
MIYPSADPQNLKYFYNTVQINPQQPISVAILREAFLWSTLHELLNPINRIPRPDQKITTSDRADHSNILYNSFYCFGGSRACRRIRRHEVPDEVLLESEG